MYGQIHCVIRELVQMKFGNEAWDIILKKSKLDEHDSFLMFTRYDDTQTFSLVGAVSDTLGVPVETVLEIFGEFFFDYCLRHGYDKMLRTLGSDIKSFIQNLDSLHSLLALSYKGISAPSFRCEDGEGGDLILHYYSGRPGLHPIVKGVLKAVARDLFHQSMEMTIIEQNKEDIGFNQSQQHTAFRVVLREDGLNNHQVLHQSKSSLGSRSLVEFNPQTVLLRASDFCAAFPYHIIFDKDLRIRQCGDLIQKHSCVEMTDGLPLTEAFSIVHPRMVLTIENIRKFINAVFLLALTPNHQQNGKKTFLLKGQMIWLTDTKHMIFIGSPRLTSLNELIEMNVYLADIPLYDVTRELVLLNQQRIAEIDIAKRLDETTAELKRTSMALEEEKSKTETLLYEMLPRKVAKALTEGRKVEAEKFDQVTVLFSDIVTFTNIASACSPMDIVNMLNEMYQRFDELTSQHKVYKVETIGDAYMIVSGVPETTRVHAQLVANFAMDMVEEAGLVKSPATSLPLQIRVGVHTGPVVAGVVGVKMPRYCLFGDTVNTASRMESHGVPGRIHLSPTTYAALLGWGYVFKNRGEMEVKGKGKMATYFLCGHLQRRMEELSDQFAALQTYEVGTENGEHVIGPSGLSQDDLVSYGVSGDKVGGEKRAKDVDTTFDDKDEVEEVSSLDGEENEESIEGPTYFCGDEDDMQSDHTVDEKIDDVEKEKGRRRRESVALESVSEKVEPARRKISSQSLASGSKQAVVGGRRLRRGNKNMSQSCNDSAVFSTSIAPPNNTGFRSASDNAIAAGRENSGPKTKGKFQKGGGDENECIYVNGSFKNAYRTPIANNRDVAKENSLEIQNGCLSIAPEGNRAPRANRCLNPGSQTNCKTSKSCAVCSRNGAPQEKKASHEQGIKLSTHPASITNMGGSDPVYIIQDKKDSLSPPKDHQFASPRIVMEPSKTALCGCSVEICADSAMRPRGRHQVHPSRHPGTSAGDPHGKGNGASPESHQRGSSPSGRVNQPVTSTDMSVVSICRDGTPVASTPSLLSSMKKSESSPASHVTWGPFPETWGASAPFSSMDCLDSSCERGSSARKRDKKKKKSKLPSKLCILS